ncbi:hypothetical protein IC582_007389 [Cucumis melo]|uniref:Uncharacterized protein At1g01500-like n=2 Tax=Cucumis melo TaxID=3656 RepID=A0A1S3CRR3_CUCME|nr:uncharacterized protein At1g01500-like [Cucumis melo]KAA0041623.1 Erythronate-4-phosphate dehydrogenase family protein isoform 1 [Cucumis melo var. makuwa]TYK19634.1 Erythronate-4-phosphate dehydrogenase family protein isoform 1 [Cucumis melo var. makuwa]
MEHYYETQANGEASGHDFQNCGYSSYSLSNIHMSSPSFDLRVFYIRFSNFQVDDLTPEFLTLNHFPLMPNTHLDVNGVRSSNYSEGFSSVLKRDRVHKNSEEATFVSTHTIRLKRGLKFEVFNGDYQILSGELSHKGCIGDSKSNSKKRWSMNCESGFVSDAVFLKGKLIPGQALISPTIEVYIAGSFSGNPIVLTKTLQLNFWKKHSYKRMLDSIPEHDTTECDEDSYPVYDPQVSKYRNYREENEDDYGNMYWRTNYMEREDGELSWFNSGVRVGVGIGLGICLGIGVGVGLLVRTYQATSRTLRRQLM